jgi:hypothetical protein
MFLSVKRKKKQFIYDIKESEGEHEDNLDRQQKVGVSHNCQFYNFTKIGSFDFKEIGAKCIQLK